MKNVLTHRRLKVNHSVFIYVKDYIYICSRCFQIVQCLKKLEINKSVFLERSKYSNRAVTFLRKQSLHLIDYITTVLLFYNLATPQPPTSDSYIRLCIYAMIGASLAHHWRIYAI